MGGFSVVRLRYLGTIMYCCPVTRMVLLVKLLKKIEIGLLECLSRFFLLDESFAVNERYAWVRCRGLPLQLYNSTTIQLWSNQCFESIGALVGKVVEMDQATLAREVLEYVRFRVRIPAGETINVTKEVCINRTVCLVSFEEEACIPDRKLRSFFSQWGARSVSDSDASSEVGGGQECSDSVGSVFDDGNGGRECEEATVQGSVVHAELGLGGAHQQRIINPSLNPLLGSGTEREIGTINVEHEVAQQKWDTNPALKALMGSGEKVEVGTLIMENGEARKVHGCNHVLDSQKVGEGMHAASGLNVEVGTLLMEHGEARKVLGINHELEPEKVVEGMHVVSEINVELCNHEPHDSCQIGINAGGNEVHVDGSDDAWYVGFSGVNGVGACGGLDPSQVEKEQVGVSKVRGVGAADREGHGGHVSLSVGAMEESRRGWQDVAVECEMRGVCGQLGDSLPQVGLIEPCGVGVETLGEEEKGRCLTRDGCLWQGGFLQCRHHTEVVLGEVDGRGELEMEGLGGDDCNLVEVRVEQGDYMVQNTVGRSTAILKPDSAFENDEKIFRLKNDGFEAAKIWCHGKEKGYTRSDQEDVVIRNLLSLESRDRCKLRNERGSPRFLDDEDNQYKYKRDRR